jgi:hypothetical protein
MMQEPPAGWVRECAHGLLELRDGGSAPTAIGADGAGRSND